MPALPKAADELVRRNRPGVLEEYPPGRAIPLPPAGLTPALRDQWGRMWVSPVANLFDPVTDRPGLARLFELYALGERLDALIADSEPRIAARVIEEHDGPPDALTMAMAVVEGNAARQALNNTIATRLRVAGEVRMLEAQFGLSPRSRLALGLTVLAGAAAARPAGLDGLLGDD